MFEITATNTIQCMGFGHLLWSLAVCEIIEMRTYLLYVICFLIMCIIKHKWWETTAMGNLVFISYFTLLGRQKTIQ